jgi:hypothetical protein
MIVSSLLPVLSIIAQMVVPSGAHLRIRLNQPVGSWSSAVGTAVSAALIAPVIVNGRVALPVGSTVAGRIESITRVGLGIRHERASLGLEFTSLTSPQHWSANLHTRVREVENARERVFSNGMIQGVRATSSISYRVSGYMKMVMLWYFHAELAEWAVKSLVVQLPEPEIYYAAGTELTVDLTEPIEVPIVESSDERASALPEGQRAGLQLLINAMPMRATDPESNRPSDVTNVLLVGSAARIADAFRAAGWSAAGPLSMRSRIAYIRAAAEVHGYSAPMNDLLLNGAHADMCWQKGLNDVSKRHHVRLWKQPGLWHGQQLWLAAATHDVNFAFLRPGRTFAHRIDSNVDEEREKVVYDLAYTSCATPVAWLDRASAPRDAQNGTGDRFVTDTRIAVVTVSACSGLQQHVDAEPAHLAARGGAWQRLLRREILVTRSDLLRANVYWRAAEALRWAFTYRSSHARRDPDVLVNAAITHALGRRQALGNALSTWE